jgi:hypothetical protein
MNKLAPKSVIFMLQAGPLSKISADPFAHFARRNISENRAANCCVYGFVFH